MKHVYALTLTLLISTTSFASYKCAKFPSTPALAPVSIEVVIGQNEAILTTKTYEGHVAESTQVLNKKFQAIEGAVFSNENYELSAGFRVGLQLTRLSTNETVSCKK